MQNLYQTWLRFKHQLPPFVKIGLNKVFRLPSRYITANFRGLPDFIIAGAQKAGTTSLYNYLLQHPEIQGALGQEVHYFDRNQNKSLRWYQAHFPLETNQNSDTLSGESCPDYMVHPDAPQLMSKILPDCRLIFLLRNPVERAYSHYRHSRRKNYEELTFDKALKAERRRLNKARETYKKSGGLPKEFFDFSYKRRGEYAKLLRNFLKHFSKNQIIVAKSENLFSNPEKVVNHVCRHLNLEPSEIIQYKRYNPGGDKKKISSETSDRLRKYYAPKNSELQDLLGWEETWDYS